MALSLLRCRPHRCADPLPQGIALRLAIFKRLAQRRDGRLQVADLPIRVTTCLAIGNGFKVGHDHASFVGRLVLNQFPQAADPSHLAACRMTAAIGAGKVRNCRAAADQGMSASGPSATSLDVRSLIAIGGKADEARTGQNRRS